MNEAAYFAVGSLLFYTIWYAGLGWFARKRTERQASFHFWVRETVLKDLPRETHGQTHKPVRRVAYPRLLLAVLTCSILLNLITRLPIRGEAQTLLLGTVALATPFLVVISTYLQFLARFIPITWGVLIGITAVGAFMENVKPWGVQPSEFLKYLMLGHAPRAVLASGVFGLIPLVTGWMVAVGCTKPVNWFAWCIINMSVGSAWVLFGLLAFRLI